MSDKQRFSVLLRPEERTALSRLRQIVGVRNNSVMLRRLIRETARRRGLLSTEQTSMCDSKEAERYERAHTTME